MNREGTKDTDDLDDGLPMPWKPCVADLGPFVIALLICLMGCKPSGQSSSAQYVPKTETLHSANLSSPDLFRLHCSPCHGDGTGNGHRAPTLSVRLKDMTRKYWHENTTDEHIRRVILDGGAAAKLNPDMRGWRRALTSQQIDGLVAYIRSLNQGALEKGPAAESARASNGVE